MLCSSCSTPLPSGAIFCVACGFKNDTTHKPAEEKLLLDRYTLEAVISKGPFSTVYHGKDKRLGRAVTLKVQNPERAKDPSVALHLQREAYLNAILPHPFSATLYSCETLKDGRCFLIMEPLEGENLAERMARQGASSAEETAAITSLMCGVLAYFHQHQIVFGNLSIENVVLTQVPFEPEPLPKLRGFGVAAGLSTNQAQLPSWLQGKSALIEDPRREFTLAQDIHSLAVFAYQLHLGHPPSEEPPEAASERPFLALLQQVIYHQRVFDSALLLKDALIESASALPPEEPHVYSGEAPDDSCEAPPIDATHPATPDPMPQDETAAAPANLPPEAPAEDAPKQDTPAEDAPKEPTPPPAEEQSFALLSDEPSLEGEGPNLEEVLLQLEQVEAAPPSYEALMRRAHRLFEQRSYDEAFAAYQEILAANFEAQTEEDLALILYHLGTIRRETGSEDRAFIFYQKAHELLPENREILRDLLGLVEKREDWERFVEYQERLLPLLEGAALQQALVVMGLALQAHLHDHERAEVFLTRAIALEPDHWSNVRHLFMLHFESKQWARAAMSLGRLAELTSDPEKRTALYYSLAGILHDELQQAEPAVRVLQLALDDSWRNHKALQKIEIILLQRREYAQLAESYQQMLQRIPEDEEPAWRASLYQKLGELYRDKLGADDLAVTCLERALSLDPSQQDALASLTDLYATDAKHGARAISFHRKKIEETPNDTDSLHSLWRLYLQQQEFDKALCVASVLTFTQQSTPEERSFYEQHRAKSLPTAQRILDAETFEAQLKSPKEDPYISGIFRLLSPFVAGLYAQKEKSLGLKPKEKIDLSRPELMLPKRFQYVAKILNVAGLSLYSQEHRAGFEYELVAQDKGGYRPVAIIGADLLSGRTDKEIVFLCGKHLSYLRPEYFLVRALKTSYGTLRVVLFAAISMISPNAIPTSIEEILIIQQLAAKLEQVIPPLVLDQVEKMVMEALASGRRLSVSNWMNQVELAANRVGFLFANDLEAAYRVLSAEKSKLSPLLTKEKMQDLTRFATQEEYFTLRKHFGFSI